MISYSIGASSQTLVFTDAVLDHFWRHRQRGLWAKEAGGQLFGRHARNLVEIVEATGPRRRDLRTPWSYEPCRELEQTEIDDRHKAGLLFLGDWHTHRQRQPSPSAQDCWNMGDIVRRSRHDLNGMLMVIVGTARPPAGLFVGISDGIELHGLSPSNLAAEISAARTRETWKEAT